MSWPMAVPQTQRIRNAVKRFAHAKAKQRLLGLLHTNDIQCALNRVNLPSTVDGAVTHA